MNGDTLFTIYDIWLLLKQLFFLPGDSLLWLILVKVPSLGTFLELSTANSQGFLSGAISAIFWVVFFFYTLCAYVVWIIHNSEMRRAGRLKNLGYDDED